MSSPLVRYTVDGAAARLTLDSPHNRNALSSALVAQLRDGLRRAEADPAVRAVVLGHTGNTFCAGADLTEPSSSSSADPYDAAAARAVELAATLRSIVECRVPVIAAVDGHVRAGGLGLVGACDVAVAGPRCTFALTEARIGVAPAIISLTLLPKLAPRAAARYFVTGETFTADRAAEIGLVTVAVDDVSGAVDDLVAELGKASPQGLAASKALTTAGVLAGFDRDAQRLAEESARLFVSDEAREGMLAFLEKRPPRWAEPTI
ncbi:MAG: enoyl-CoA hydratase family protein [Mycobacterium sp.]|nr:MAG: enoyl-CoA hydratase family protein [Mycobacterium sp.]